MTPQQKARAASIITGLRQRERQLETRLAGWEFEALVLLQELAAEPMSRRILTTRKIALLKQGADYDVTSGMDIDIVRFTRAVEREHGIST